jgi:phospholipase/carboxylesterase
MEFAAERLAPQRSADLAEETKRAHLGALEAAERELRRHPPPADLHPFATRLDTAFAAARQACELFCSFPEAPAAERIPRILGALHWVARSQEAFYSLRTCLPPFADYWPAPAGLPFGDVPPVQPGEHAPLGVTHVSAGEHHGGFSLYVPEDYRRERQWPTIVALHGGSGNGRDFLWTWLREARKRGYLLVAPTAVAGTWSGIEERGILEILAWLRQRYSLAADRVLLTGLSDGATFTLLYGLAHPEVFRGLAALCGVLHPANAAIGNLERAAGVPIYLVHGALDFLFPVALARHAREVLSAAGARLHYRELAELSHTYPTSENALILDWFGALGQPTATA